MESEKMRHSVISTRTVNPHKPSILIIGYMQTIATNMPAGFSCLHTAGTFALQRAVEQLCGQTHLSRVVVSGKCEQSGETSPSETPTAEPPRYHRASLIHPMALTSRPLFPRNKLFSSCLAVRDTYDSDLCVGHRTAPHRTNRRENDRALLPDGRLEVGCPVAMNPRVEGHAVPEAVSEVHSRLLKSHLWGGATVGQRVQRSKGFGECMLRDPSRHSTGLSDVTGSNIT